MRYLAIVILTIFVGCDEPGSCLGEGGPFGPCPPDSHVCGPGLICLDAKEGTACLPYVDQVTPEVSACADLVGGITCDGEFSEMFGICRVACITDADCVGDSVCSDTYKACVRSN